MIILHTYFSVLLVFRLEENFNIVTFLLRPKNVNVFLDDTLEGGFLNVCGCQYRHFLIILVVNKVFATIILFIILFKKRIQTIDKTIFEHNSDK